MNRNFVFFVCFIFLLFSPGVSAQKVVKVVAEHSYTVPNTVMPAEAEYEAIRRAQTQAIKDEFGTLVSETSQSSIKSGVDGDTDDFFSLQESDVCGFWLRTTSDTLITRTFNDKEKTTTYSVRLEGEIEEQKQAPLDVQYKFLFNGTNPERNEIRNNSFNDGDKVYVWFKAPVDGYLAIYNVDHNDSKIVQCLYPYEGCQITDYKLKGDSVYILFSDKDAPRELRAQEQDFWIGALTNHDFNQFYVIFSPQEFHKPAENASQRRDDGTILPPKLGFREFQRWLSRNRHRDKNMFVEKLFVDIYKK